jgi:hypothetical protein
MRVYRALRSRLVLGLVVSLASVVVLGATTTATAAPRTFSGTTSQDLPISFVVGGSGGSFVITQMAFNFNLICEDGQLIGAGVGFFGFNVPIDSDGRFQFDYVNVFQALHWKGRVAPRGARGTATYLLPGLTADEQAQLCPSGDVTWFAAPSARPAGRFHADVRIKVVRDAAGHVSTSINRTGS